MTALSFEVFAKDHASGTFDKLGRSVDNSTTKMQKFQKVGAIAGKALGIGLLGAAAGAVKLTKAAADDEQAQIKLATALKNSAGASKTQIAATEAWITAQGKATGITDDELRPALARLTAATHDVGKAQRLASLAQNVAAGSGQSLETVTKALVKAQNGSVAGLAKLGIKVKESVKDSTAQKTALLNLHKAQDKYNQVVKDSGPKSQEAKRAAEALSIAQVKLGESQQKIKSTTIGAGEAMKRLATTYKGQAAKAADTAAGKQKILMTQLSELGESIGAKLLPVMLKLANAGVAMVDWVSKNTTVVGIAVGTIVTLTAAVWAVSLATKAWAAATTVGTAAQSAYAAVTGLSTGIVSTYVGVKYLEAAAWVRSTAASVAASVATGAHSVALVAGTVATTAMAAATWLLNGAMLVLTSPITAVVVGVALLVAGVIIAYKKVGWFRAGVQAMGKGVVAAFKWVVNAARAAFNWIKGNWKLILAVLTGPFGLAVFVIAKNWDRIKAGASAAVGFVKGKFGELVNFVKSIPGKIGDLAGQFLNAGKSIGSKVMDGIFAGLRSIGGFAGDLASSIKGAINSALHLPFTIKGPGPLPDFTIPAFARGVTNFGGGLALVGERGPEYVNLPRGSDVYPTGTGPSGGRPIQITVHANDRPSKRALMDAMHDASVLYGL